MATHDLFGAVDDANTDGVPHSLRKPCSQCGGSTGTIRHKNGQDCVYCSSCGRHQYNAPRVETGRAVRSVSTVHAGIKPKQRFRVLERAAGRCQLCGFRGELHIGHVLSVVDGLAQGLTEETLNSYDNLIALCPQCNLGEGKASMPPWLAAALLRARQEDGERVATWDEVLP